MCFEALDGCTSGSCPTFSNHLASFRRQLAGLDGRVVRCDRAEVGTCGDYRYFSFEGDVHRYETLWFDSTEQLVAVDSSTDYRAYCNGTTLMTLRGELPTCDDVVRQELICGSGESPVPMLRYL
jgi:hypothetical protein